MTSASNPNEPVPLMKEVADLEDRDCRYAIECDGPLMRFCGHETVKGKSYCSHHYARVVGPGTVRERAAHLELKKVLTGQYI